MLLVYCRMSLAVSRGLIRYSRRIKSQLYASNCIDRKLIALSQINNLLFSIETIIHFRNKTTSFSRYKLLCAGIYTYKESSLKKRFHIIAI